MTGFPLQEAAPFAMVLIGAALPLAAAFGASDPGGLCDRAAATATLATGVPLEILQAISRVETGRQFGNTLHPWPWAVNHAGEGHWFSTREEATAFVASAIDLGESNLDIGCFQLNYHWHSDRFASIDQMFDPEENALRAAEFLTELKSEGLDWRGAVAAYHSRDDRAATAYLARFDAALGAPPDDQPVPAELGSIRFPLLLIGAHGAKGSLVPQVQPGQRLVGAGGSP